MVTNEQSDLSISPDQVEAIVACVLEGFQVGTVEVIFVDKKKMGAVHAEHFDDPSPTDCMTFPIDPPGPDCEVLGTVFVCPKVAIEFDTQDPYRECTLYIVHGLLHLLGFRDQTDKEKQEMRNGESLAMKKLETNGLILTPTSC